MIELSEQNITAHSRILLAKTEEKKYYNDIQLSVEKDGTNYFSFFYVDYTLLHAKSINYFTLDHLFYVLSCIQMMPIVLT